MSELRKDPILGRWVIIAKNRAGRPNEFASAPAARSQRHCPFCEGHESQTPHELAAYREPGTAEDTLGWQVRVIANKFPALSDVGNDTVIAANSPLYQSLPAYGAHEVIIETPRHSRIVGDLSVGEFTDVLCMYRDRLAFHSQNPRLKYGFIFKNVGAAGGASIEHMHSQFVATAIVPTAITEKLAASLAYFQAHGECAYCAVLNSELAAGVRVITESSHYAAYAPYASRFPYETWILPKRHATRFEAADSCQLAELAQIAHRIIGRIEQVCDPASYNVMIHTSPFDMREPSHYHWHMEIIPPVTTTAGFEWGTGFFINPVPPEEAADLLRQ